MARETEDKSVVRMPLGLRDQLKQKAVYNHRSANSEIVHRLERNNKLREEFTQTDRVVDELFTKNQHLQVGLAATDTPQVQATEA